jgi:hypothetical protein
MSKLIFNPVNKMHRRIANDFLTSGEWLDSYPDFSCELYTDIFYLINAKLAIYYLQKEFPQSIKVDFTS